jgi:hypothetical protein
MPAGSCCDSLVIALKRAILVILSQMLTVMVAVQCGAHVLAREIMLVWMESTSKMWHSNRL